MKKRLILAVVGLSIVAAIFLTEFLPRLQEKPPTVSDSRAVKTFTELYSAKSQQTWMNTYWLGTRVVKIPLDLWVYQEIIYETKPDVLIETGTYKGGSAYFFASIFELLNRGRVLSIDIKDQPEKPKHQRITYLVGPSTSKQIFQEIKSSIRQDEKVMVSRDSDHSYSHVTKELRLYSQLVTVGNYLVVEDTRVVAPGAGQALEKFMEETSDFIRDRSREKFLLTGNPGGFLKRVR